MSDTGWLDTGWRRDFRWRWAAQATSDFGTAVGYTALPIAGVLLLDVSDFQVSLLTVMSSVVSALLVLPLGPWIEYHRKRPVMIGADLLRFAAIGSIPLAAWFGWLTYWHLCLVVIVKMAGDLAFSSASVADLRTLVPPGFRAEANSRFETTLWTANTFGPPAGGMLISWLGVAASLVVDALSYLASALGIRQLRTPEPPPPQRLPSGTIAGRLPGTRPFWRRAADRQTYGDLIAGWRYILGHRGLAALFWNSLIFGGCITAASPLLIVFMLRDRGFEPWQYGLVFGVPGIAGIAGTLMVGPALRRFGRRRVLLVSGVGRNLWLGLIPFATPSTAGLALIAASELMLLLFVGFFNPTFATYRMDATDDRHMARVVMAWAISSRTSWPLFIAAAGLLAAATSARTALFVLAAILVCASALLPWRDA
ncbi:MAG TPA: MFS transporter [Candidatus Limnocylindrales bacterium]